MDPKVLGLPRQYILYPDGSIEQCDDVHQFAAWYNEISNRQVERTAVPYGDFTKAVIVSTVFLGFGVETQDGNPVLFETLAEIPEGPSFTRRYTDMEDALEGHATVVRQIEQHFAEQDKDEIDALLERAREVPQPRRRKVKEPNRKAPDPDCPECFGTGEVRSRVLGIVDNPCDCTIVRRKAPPR